MPETALTNCHAATMDLKQGPYGAIRDAAVLLRDGRIAWVGPRRDLPNAAQSSGRQVVDLGGAWLLPGFVDCHTHLVFAGSRGEEFEQRLAGKSYADIARAGGGILRTVLATRAASDAELLRSSVARARALRAEGVTTVEIKSGYGLDPVAEMRLLQVAGAVAKAAGLHVEATFLGAHVVPVEFQDRRKEYLDSICDVAIPKIAAKRLAGAVDVFCENIAFTLEETARVFRAAKAAGLAIKVHAEQLSNMGAARLASEHGALSADHLEYLDSAGVAAMAKGGTVAVLLPLPFYFLRETQRPPVQALRDGGVPIAVASDINPGSAPMGSLLLALNMAAVLFGLTPEEALLAATVNAARALGLYADRGQIAAGMRADLAAWPVDHPRELVATFSMAQPSAVYVDGD